MNHLRLLLEISKVSVLSILPFWIYYDYVDVMKITSPVSIYILFIPYIRLYCSMSAAYLQFNNARGLGLHASTESYVRVYVGCLYLFISYVYFRMTRQTLMHLG